jgi:ankyrin repeat protein/L-ascorbate metabolism protein UlaG (beta-lactamase superfamily)
MSAKIKRVILTMAALASLFPVLHPAEIHEAVRRGNLAEVQGMLAKDPGLLNARDDQGRTPLLTAIAFRQEEVFKTLLASGADVRLADRDGVPPLLLACYFGLAEWTEPLIRKGAEINAHANVLGYSPLHAAVRGGHDGCIERLLASGARLDLRDTAGNTPLLLAAANGREEAAGRLLTKGASPLDKNAMGSTALHLASLTGNVSIVNALLEKGATVNDSNRYGNSPLAIAAREGHDAVVKILTAAGAKMSPKDRPELKGEYLGQPEPGATPALFAPGVVSTEKSELNSVFTPDGREFYFTIQKAQGSWTIMVMKREGNLWSSPRTASFSGSHSDVDLFIAPDGKKLFFCSNRPRSGKAEAQKNYDIWVVERKGGGWSEPANLGAPVNSDQDEFFPSLTRDGTLYFQSRRPESGGGAHIYRARLEEGAYRRVEKLDATINCEPFIGDTLVAPDESWVVFSVSRPSGFGRGDLHVSFRKNDHSWTEPLNLGSAINTQANENCPILSPDGKYLFYTSADDIHWVSAGVIDVLRPLAMKAEAGAGEKPRTGREPLQLVRIANSGVMLAAGETKVLIDALFDSAPSDYRSPDPAVLDAMTKGRPPFDGIDLALVTHNHPDHFAAPLAARFLEANPGATLLAPEDAVAEMRREAAWPKIATRVASLDLALGEQAQREIAGVSLAACRTLHSGQKKEPLNLMYRFCLDGWNVFHEGDADATLDEYRGFGLAEAKIDLALVHFWFPLHPDMAKLLQEVIEPAHIGLTHLPIRLESDAPSKIDMVRQYYKDIFLLLPGMPAKTFTGEAERPRPVRALVLLGEWFGDAYFPLQKEMQARGWTQKRIGVDSEYRGCYKKKRDVVLTSEVLIPELNDLSAWDVLIVPSGPQFRKFKENPAVLEFLKQAHASGLLVASFCVGNFLVQAAGLVPEGTALFPEKVTRVREGLLLGPRGGGPPPGDGFASAPIKEICDAIERETAKGKVGN